tara:strand:+ start:62206 stop:63045 length:840 start_codon:yes stop_codon:yes gene_type:complete
MKAQPFKIPKKLNQSLIVQVNEASSFYNKLHQHEEVQISYIKKGHGKLIVADSIHSFKENDIFIIGSNCPHVFKSAEECEKAHMVILFFTKESFHNSYTEIPELELMQLFFSITALSLKINSKTKAIASLMHNLVTADKFSRFIIFLKLIRKISNADVYTLSVFKYKRKITDSEGKRMQVIFDYAMKNFQNTISLETMSELVFMTPNAFCRFFKQRTNKTFFQFLIQLRIEHACQLLENETDLSMAAVSIKSGFNSISNFNRQFRSVKNCAPSIYIKIK